MGANARPALKSLLSLQLFSLFFLSVPKPAAIAEMEMNFLKAQWVTVLEDVQLLLLGGKMAQLLNITLQSCCYSCPLALPGKESSSACSHDASDI